MRLRPITATFILGITILTTAHAAASAQTITATHTYVMGDNDSRNDARRICFLEAKRKVLEKAGTYIESSSEIKNFQLSKDQINSYTAAVLSVETVKEDFSTKNGQTTVTMTVKANVNTADVRKRLAAIVADRGLQEKIAAQQQQLKQLEEQMRALNAKLGTDTGAHTGAATANSARPSAIQDWLARARPLNPEHSDKELVDFWIQTYGLRQERDVVLGQIQDLENKKRTAVQRITAKTGLIKKYIVRNMTAEEVIGILGPPQMKDDYYGNYFYGEKWICFSRGVVHGVGKRVDCEPDELAK